MNVPVTEAWLTCQVISFIKICRKNHSYKVFKKFGDFLNYKDLSGFGESLNNFAKKYYVKQSKRNFFVGRLIFKVLQKKNSLTAKY